MYVFLHNCSMEIVYVFLHNCSMEIGICKIRSHHIAPPSNQSLEIILFNSQSQIMYEAATVEDIYQLYNNFNFDDNHIFTCIGISGGPFI